MKFSRVSEVVPLVNTRNRSIRSMIPAPGTGKILERLDRVESRSMHGQLPIVWSSAFEATVLDICSNMFIDFTSGIFVANVGHRNLAVVNALRRTADIDCLHSYSFATMIRAEYLERLTAWARFEKAFLLSSGTEATEAALKLMRMNGAKTGRRKIVCLQGAFHGRTMGAQLMGKPDAWTASDPDISHVNTGQNISLIDAAGVMIEAYEGWSAKFHDREVVRAIATVCKTQDTLLCFDEMQSGFGRTGKKFGFEHYGVRPDLVCVGKGMGGGFPVSGVLGSAAVMDLPEVGNMSSTHSANPLACAAGLAVLDEIDRLDLVNQADLKGAVMLGALVKALPGYTINGMGLVAAVIFPSAEFASQVAYRCYQKGLLVVHTGRESVKIGPPLVIGMDALVEGVQVFCDAVHEIEGELCK